jgi:hypothetical protein
MKLPDLVKPLDQLTDDELLERLRQARHNREVHRPAAKKLVERAEIKASRSRMSSMDKLLANLSDEDREALINKLEEL